MNRMAFSRIVDARLPEDPELRTCEVIENQLGLFEDVVYAAGNACIRWVPMRRQFTAIDAYSRQLIQQRNTVRRPFQRSRCPLKKHELSLLNRMIMDRMITIRNQPFAKRSWQMDDHSRPF